MPVGIGTALVTGTAFTPNPFGLFSVVDLRPEGDGRWMAGIQWEHPPCDPNIGGLGEQQCDPPGTTAQPGIQVVSKVGVPTTGQFWLRFSGRETIGLPVNASAAQVRDAINAVGPEQVTVSGANGGPWTVTTVTSRAFDPITVRDTFDVGDLSVSVTQAGTAGGTIGLPKTFDGESSTISQASPFTVYGTFTCQRLGWSADEVQERAVDTLVRHEERRVEQAIWTGDLGNEPSFQTPAVDLGTWGDPSLAISALEGALADVYGGQGVLHVPLSVVTHLIALRALEVRSGNLVTAAGTPVVAGAGYPLYPDSGADVQFVITPPLIGYRSDVVDAGGADANFNTTTNEQLAIAERTYVIGWDCPSISTITASVTLPVPA